MKARAKPINPVKEIIKELTGVSAISGNSQSSIFEDWLAIVEASLETIPARLANNGQTPFKDTPEVEELFNRVHSRYPRPECWDHFVKAFESLVIGADDWEDYLGNVYMEFGHPKSAIGQVFTPFSVADCMAKMSLGDIETMVHERIKQACYKDPLAQAILMAGILVQDPEEARQYFFEKVLPAALPHIDPIRIQDPCCGSGVMLLAAAKHSPRWAIDYGIVQFYGADIDMTCVRMAKINLMLHGMNCFWLKCALSMSANELNTLPELFQAVYSDAQVAQQTGDTNMIEVIKEELRTGAYKWENISATKQILTAQ
jgi:type I restriction-modification system DNA methylase subunit